MTKAEFLKDVGNWSNHRYLLWEALEATRHLNLPVLELGCGDGSTPFLQQYCKDNGLDLFSYDFNSEWAIRFDAHHVINWDSSVDWKRNYSVVLVDESPGEHRKTSIRSLINSRIVVVHDSEPVGWNSSDYQVRPEFMRYAYTYDLKSEKPEGAWATWLSNYFVPPITKILER